MQIPSRPSSSEFGSQFFSTGASLIEGKKTSQTDYSSRETLHFKGDYIGHMEMYADAASVARYLDAHQEWFHRCAEPMTVEAIGDNGYSLTVGKFKSLNHEVEPKIGLHLLPQEEGVYRIETVPVPGHTPAGYEVDFKASMTLCECPAEDLGDELPLGLHLEKATHVEWELTLTTSVDLPRFLQVLPENLVKASGDKLLNQIVRQVSKRLTQKVQREFHTALDLPIPNAHTKRFWKR